MMVDRGLNQQSIFVTDSLIREQRLKQVGCGWWSELLKRWCGSHLYVIKYVSGFSPHAVTRNLWWQPLTLSGT